MAIFHFGKYDNEKIEDIAKTDGKYIIWLRKQKWIKEELKTDLDEVMDDVVLNFGKHAGTTVGSIKKTNPDYYKWLFKP